MIQKPQKATHHVSALFELSGQVEGTSCVVFYTETISMENLLFKRDKYSKLNRAQNNL